ncbi:MAG: hypothetical protein Q4F54_06275 [Coriobacteriia bacterium]|nr:hypothetical protein [Coriobacteriia bacterium]
MFSNAKYGFDSQEINYMLDFIKEVGNRVIQDAREVNPKDDYQSGMKEQLISVTQQAVVNDNKNTVSPQSCYAIARRAMKYKGELSFGEGGNTLLSSDKMGYYQSKIDELKTKFPSFDYMEPR